MIDFEDLDNLELQFKMAAKDRTPEIIIDPRLGLLLIKNLREAIAKADYENDLGNAVLETYFDRAVKTLKLIEKASDTDLTKEDCERLAHEALIFMCETDAKKN
jgi:hypothetical protein